MQCLFVCVQGFRVAVVAAADDDIGVDPYKLLMTHEDGIYTRMKVLLLLLRLRPSAPASMQFHTELMMMMMVVVRGCVCWVMCVLPKKKKKSKQKSSDRKSKNFPVYTILCMCVVYNTPTRANVFLRTFPVSLFCILYI